MPVVLRTVLADRYSIGMALLVAAICVGLLKVVAALAAAAVNALGSPAEIIRLSLIGWLAIGVAVLGAAVGAHWGLTGLVYGVGFGWLTRAVAVGYIAAPHLLRESDHPTESEGAASGNRRPPN
jgi:vacuolar-type H+-ATPase subunit I/STV1